MNHYCRPISLFIYIKILFDNDAKYREQLLKRKLDVKNSPTRKYCEAGSVLNDIKLFLINFVSAWNHFEGFIGKWSVVNLDFAFF